MPLSLEDNMETTKICTCCNTEKSIKEFSIRTDTNKYRRQCKQCVYESTKKFKNRKLLPKLTEDQKKQKRKEYYLKNKEKIKSRNEEYYKENKEYFKEKAKENYHNNRDRRLRVHKIWASNNKEYIREENKKWRIENKDYLYEYNKKYKEENREQINKRDRTRNKTEARKISMLNKSHKRRTIEKRGDVSNSEIKKLLNESTKCYWCNKKLSNKKHLDHYIPLSKGGEHTLTNLVVSCPTCNLQKNAKDPYQFAQEIGRLL